MTYEFFKDQLNRLKTEWKSAYGKEKEAALYQVLGNSNPRSFEHACTELLLNHKGSAPTAEEIKSVIFEIEQRDRQKQSLENQSKTKDPRAPYDCEPCGDSGYRLIEDDQGYRRIYLCDCGEARAKPKKIFWKSGFQYEHQGYLNAKNKLRQS